MENKLLDLSYTDLRILRDTTEQQLAQLRSVRAIVNDINRTGQAIADALTMKQCEAWQFGKKELHQITKSKKILGLYSQWQTFQKELQIACDLLKLFWDARYILDRKKIVQPLQVINGQGFSFADRALYRVSKRLSAGKAQLSLVK